MAARKSATAKKLPPSATRLGRVELMLERLQDQQKATLEAVHACREEMIRRMDDRFDRLSMRIDVVEGVMRAMQVDDIEFRANIALNKANIAENAKVLAALDLKVADARAGIADLRRRLDELSPRIPNPEQTQLVEQLERRIAALEAEVGIANRSTGVPAS